MPKVQSLVCDMDKSSIDIKSMTYPICCVMQAKWRCANCNWLICKECYYRYSLGKGDALYKDASITRMHLLQANCKVMHIRVTIPDWR